MHEIIQTITFKVGFEALNFEANRLDIYLE